MSASSSSNISTNTGPNRFRGDAASFSPSQHSPSIINQQIYQQQVQQQVQQHHLYSQYLYSNGGPLMHNQFYQYMPQYMIPNSPGGYHHPDASFYPYAGYQIPPPHMGYPIMNPNINGISYPQGPKMAHKKNNKPEKYSHTTVQVPYIPSNGHTHNQSAPSTIRKEEKVKNSPVNLSTTNENHEKTNKSEGEVYISQTSSEKTNANAEPITDNSVPKTSVSSSLSSGPLKNDQIKGPSISYPLFFNSDAKEYAEYKSSNAEKKKYFLDQKNNRLNNLMKDELSSTNGLLISIKDTKIVDLNTNSIVVAKANSNIPSYNKNNDHDNDSGSPPYNVNEIKNNEGNENISDEIRQSSSISKNSGSTNWASILQSSPAVKKQTKAKLSNSVNSTLVVSPPTRIIPPISTPDVSPTKDFNINNESSQPLGVLLLKIMFDENFSITSSTNNCPVFKLRPRGLTNTGNICYMNSILQILIFCEPFNKLLKLIENKSVGSLKPQSTTPLLDSTISFLNDFINKSQSKALSPEDFYMNLISHPKFQHLKWGQQEDAEEFLGYYLDGLNEEFLNSMKSLNTPNIDSMIQNYASFSSRDANQIIKFKSAIKNTMKIVKKSPHTKVEEKDEEWSEVGANNKKISINRTVEIEPTPITTIFGGQFKSVLTIPKSSSQNQKSITLDPFQNIQLDISESDSIEEAFVNLNKLENISYKASNNKEISIKKQTFIDKLPNILIIHLKRFSYLKEKDVGIEKLCKRVKYDHQLEIPRSILSSPIPSDYKLISVVYHHGSSAEGGHYTSDVLCSSILNADASDKQTDDEWIRIDDTSIKPIDKEDVLESGSEDNRKSAYILMYQKCE